MKSELRIAGMSSLWLIISAVFLSTVVTSQATTYWVATNGSDSNDGLSSNTPFATPQKAVTLSGLTAGDLIYVCGGNYSFNSQVKPGKAGTAGNPIKLWAYPGELPIFDFTNMPSGSTKALDVRRDYWHVRGIEVKYAPDSGIFVGGNGNIIEGCIVHDCKNDGIILGSTTVKTTNALILNCDSYRNYQPGDGNQGDGFAAKDGCGPGNIFRGCRSWYNSDDGWDFYNNAANNIVLDQCWSFHNGTNLWGVTNFAGNGNGFKLGGGGTTANHVLKNCLAFKNHSKGFDQNHTLGGQTMVNCTSFANGGTNFSFYEAITAGTNCFTNNASYLGKGVLINASFSEQTSNSWQFLTVTSTDFSSLDDSLAFAVRNADYSLPTNNFLRLNAGSQLIDKGVDVGLPFNGGAPDLGAFEFQSSAPAQTASWFDLSGTYWTNGGFQMLVSGLTGHGDVVIHASPDLLSWSPVSTNPPVTGSMSFLDAAAVSEPQRFYRAEEK